ncbi:MAG TPA: EF-hand domain-containing protein [Oscillatoriaceae cyanobacterium]
MKKLFALIAVPALLAGCGGAPGMMMASVPTAGGYQSASLYGAEKGVKGLFTYVFKQLDKDQNGVLTVDELPPTMDLVPVPGAQAPEQVDPQDMLTKLDLNHDGKVSLYEFSQPQFQEPVIETFRYLAGVQFAQADRDGNRILDDNEVGNLPETVSLAQLDENHDGKVTLSEFENVLAQLAAQGQLFGNAVSAPQAPAASGN